MSQPTSAEIRRPRTDERPLRDLLSGFWGFPAVLIAHDLKLFPLLATQPRTLREVCDALQIADRPAEALLAVCASLRLVKLQAVHYSLTLLAEDYLLDNSPTYYGGYFDMLIANYPVYSFESVKRAVLTDSPQVYAGADLYKSHEDRVERARAFTRAMHSISIGPALAWPDAVDLSKQRMLLDVGGGSGAHALGALRRWPQLHATVFDLAPVCDVAQEFAARYGLQERIRTHVGDMWTDAFPPADLHVYSLIYHNWPSDKCRFLTQKSYASLDPGGRIIIHEILYNDDKTGPFHAAAFSIQMLLWTAGKQYAGSELAELLREGGFTDIEVKGTFGYWGIVTGRKPEHL